MFCVVVTLLWHIFWSENPFFT